LKAWQPLLTPGPVIISFLVIGIVFVPLGVVLLITSNNIGEIEVRYDNVCGGHMRCTVNLTNVQLRHPVYMYYKLSNFYQNHRRYVKSRNDAQLQGQVVLNYASLIDCDPRISKDNSQNSSMFYVPCGLIAWSLFNDSFVLRSLDANQTVPLRKNGIAWQSDVSQKFNNPPYGSPGIRVIPNMRDEDFIVWMRIAGLPTFRKLYRIIDNDLNGNYAVDIFNNFPVESFFGTKSIVLSEISWMGGKNPFLGYAYIVVGSLCFLLGILFLIKHVTSGRKLGDTSYLSWNR